MSGIFNRKNLVPLLAAWLMLADISAKSVKETNTQPSPNVVNELFEGYLVNRQHDALYHHILKDIDLKRNSAAIPGIALCSVKRADQGKSSDREAFMKAIASVVNRINGIVLDHRLFVIAVRDKTRAGIKLTEKENKKFQLICLFYQSNDIRALLEKIGPVSVSLAVAQASLESGFGSNEILHRNNAFFGMMKDSTRLYSFDTLFESVIAYVKTLNVHPCYRQFRLERNKMLASAQKIDGTKLVQYLGSYAEKKNYRSNLSKIMEYHNLHLLDRSYKSV